MQRIIGRYRRSAFVRNIAVLASGTAIAQTITVAATLVLSRLYDPAEFGIMAVLVAMWGQLAAVASWKYELAIVLANDDEDAAALFALSCFIVVLMFLLVALAMIFVGDWLAAQLGNPEAAPLMLLVPVMGLVGGLHAVFTSWATRRKKFAWQAVSRVSQSTSTACIQILAGLAEGGAKGLVYGRIFGGFISSLFLAVPICRHDGEFIFRSTSFRRVKKLALKHDKFPKYNAPRALLASLSNDFVSIFLAFLFSPAAAGLYWLTYRVLWVPHWLIGDAVRRVFYQRTVELHHDRRNILPIFIRTTFSLMAIGSVPTLIIVAFAPPLFQFAFGSEWHKAGVFAQWLVILWYSSFSNVPSNTLIPVLGLQPFFLGFEVVATILRLIALSVGAILANDIMAIALFSVVGVFFNVFGISYIFYHVRGHRKNNMPRM